MSDRIPPRLAVWWLERTLANPHDDSLIGDLLEQFANGRSRAWFWRQALIACGLGIARQINAHKWQSARALAIGWALYWLTALGVISVLPIIHSWTWAPLAASHSPSMTMFLSQAVPATVLIFLAHAVVGWGVGRLHRPFGIAMVSLFCACLLVQTCVAMGMAFVFTPPPVPLSGLGLWLPIASALTRLFCVLLGGMYGAGARPAAP